MRLRSLLGGLLAALTVTATAAPTPVLAAQKSEVVVMNQAEVIAKSKAGQSIAAQIKTFADEATKELTAAGSQLQQQAASLQQRAESMSDDEKRKEAQQFALQQRGAQQLQQIKTAEITRAEQAAIAQLAEQLEPVVREIMKKRKARVVLRRTDVAVMDDAVDITDDVIKALDRRVTTIKVTKPDIQAELRQAAAQQQANQ